MTDSLGGIWWFTGLSGAGKTTLGTLLVAELNRRGSTAFLIDGDELRAGLCADLGFSDADRSEQTRRAAELASLMARQGCHAVVSLISPFAEDRAAARRRAPAAFHEVYVSTALDVCRDRDTKGLYQQKVSLLTGVSSRYEAPGDAQLVLDTAQEAVSESFRRLCDYLDRQTLPLPSP